MKTCQICSTENASDAVTCIACGEGSFGTANARAVPCAACAALNGSRPCSVECYVKAGYKAENYESFIANIEQAQKDRDAERAKAQEEAAIMAELEREQAEKDQAAKDQELETAIAAAVATPMVDAPSDETTEPDASRSRK